MKAGDRKVYVIDGDVVQYTDKSGIDVAKSDKSIVVCDAETGKYEYTSPDQLMNVGEPADPSTLSEAYMANERAKEVAANGEGTAESNAAANGDVSADGGKAEVEEPAYSDGSRVEINGHEYDVKSAGEKTVVLVDEHGKELAWTRSALDAKLESGDAEVLEPKAEAAPDVATEGLKAGDVFADSDGNALTVKRVDGDKVVAVGADGKEQTYEDGMFEQMVESGVLKRAQKTEEPSEAKVDLTDNQGNSTPQPDLSSESKGAEQSSGVQAEVPQVDVQENAPMPMRVVGKGKNAVQEEDWLATTPKRGHDYVFKESGLDAEEANAFVENKVAEAEKNLEKVKGKAPKMGTNIAAYKEAKADYEARVAEAQKAVDYWHAVKAERDKVLLEERRARKEKDKALYDDAVAQEEQRKAEMAQKAAEQEALGSNAVAPAIKEKWENAPKVDGGADEITLPNGEVVTGHYVLTESGAASASHQATNGFAETEGYPVDVNGETVNDRDYKRDAEAQQVTRGMAADYDSRALQSPVVVSGDGVVLSGNGRTMAGEIAALNGSDAKYNAYLRGHAGKFGFTTEQVEGFKHPRVVFVPDGEMPYTSETFAKFNQREQKSQSRTEMAVKLGKVVDDALFGRVMDVIGRHESLAEFYADDAATASVVKELADAGVIPQTEMAQLFDGGRLSESGQAMVEGVLVGKVFQGSPDAVRQITEVKSMRKAVMVALPEVVACHRLGGGYDLSKELAAAVDLVYKARKAGFKLGQHVSQHARQGNLFQLDDGATVADYNNAAVMMLADVMNDGRVTQLKKVLSFYNTQAADSAQGIGDMFAGGVKSKGQIINEVNELLNNGQEYDRRTPSVADGQGVGGEGGEQGDVAGPSHQGGAGSERGLSEAFDGLAAQLKTAEGDERKRVLGEMRDGIARFAEENGYPVPEFLLTREDFLAAVPEKDRAKYVEMLEKGMRMPAYYENKKVYYFVEGCDNFDKDVAETLAHEYTHADNAEFPENVNAIVYAVEDTHEVSQDELVDILEKLSDSTVYEEKAEQLEAEGKNANPMLADEVIAHSVGRMVVEGEQALDGITKNPTLQFFIKRAYKERENERQHNLYSNRNAERADKTVPSSGRNSSDNEAVAGGTPGDGQLGGSSEGDGHLEGTAERGRSAVSNGKEVAAPSEDGAKVGVTDGEKSSATGDAVPSGKGDTPLSEKIATASAEVNTEPTEAQKEAGNYKKGHVQVGTFDITIEQPQGSVRKGTDADGKQWESKMNNTYGYIRGAVGVDGDHIDVFLSNDIDSWNGRRVFVVDQYNPDGSFDEHKVMLGFNDADEAKSDYLANYENGWENGRRIDVTAVNLEDFEKWIASSKRKTKPFGEYSSVKNGVEPSGKGKTDNPRQQKAVGKSAQPPTREESILRDVVIEHMKGSGLDVIGTEDGQRVLDMANDDGAKEHRVYHGSGAEFDHFDHSHMGEGEGAQAYGWGTYVTEVRGIGEGYAIRSKNGISMSREEWSLKRSELESNIYRAKEQLPFLKGEYKAEVEAQISEWEEQLKDYEPHNYLYTVEIPDDNGGNYLDWNGPVPAETIDRITEYLREKYGDEVVNGRWLSNPLLSSKGVDVSARNGAAIYRQLERALGSDKKASLALAELGYAGIKYPAEFRSGGRKDDAKNYVIFNENDAEITDHVRFFKTKNGEAYGFTVGGKIYYDPRIANAETPVHEYAHLWASALKANNAKEWKNVVELMKGTKVWEEVKKTYPELETDDEIADEVLATYSGRRGAERLREEMRKAAAEGDGVMGKAEAVSALQRVKRAIDRFWKAVADFLHIHYTSAEEVADRVMKDLLDGVDPRSMMDGGKSLRPETRVNVVEAEAGHGFKNYAEAKTWAKEHIARTYSGEETGGKGDIRISNAAVDKYLSQSAVDKSESKDVHLAVLKVLPDVIRESVDAEQHADFKKGKDGVRSAANGVNPNVTIHRLYGAVRMDGKLYRVKVTLKENTRTKETPKAYSYEATKIELLEGSLSQTEGSHNLEPSNSKSEVSAGQHGNVSGLTSTFPRYSDKSITAANLLNGVDKSYDGGKFFEDYNKIREQFIGEKGAAAADHADEVNTRLDNLSVAREMEAEKKDAKAIKMATGWERGADGKWRYEMPDAKIKETMDIDGHVVKRFDEDMLWNDGKLADVVDAPELFKAYPQLKETRIVTDAVTGDMPSTGDYNAKTNTITIHADELKYMNGILNHEVQHAIQKIEGLARGGSPAMVRSEIKKQMAEVTKQIRQLRAEGKEAEAKELIKKNRGLYEASVGDDDFGSYKSLAGEVESRNVESRMGMSAEERRASLAAETEDVSREDQIFLMSGDGGRSYSLKDGSFLRSGSYFSGGGLLEEGLKDYLNPKVAVEFNEKISGVYRDNFGNHIVTADVRDVDPKELVKDIDGPVQYFHASPVCKNFSTAKRDGGEVELDKETARSTAQFIGETRPKVVTIEDVKGYKNSDALKIITDELTAQGYDWDMGVYNAADYGGYTNRERLIVRAVRDGKLPPKPEALPEGERKGGWIEAVSDLMEGLPEKKSGVPKWVDERLKGEGIDYRHIDKPLYVFGQGNSRTSIPHAFADELLPTLRTKGGDMIIMPDGRVLKVTPRVLARVTGLADDYEMPATDDLAHTVVGNGIPTQLSEHVIGPLLADVFNGGEPARKDGSAHLGRGNVAGEMGAAEDYTAFASRYGVSEDMVKDYALGMETGNLQKANFALTEIRRTMRVANRGMKLSEFGKLFRPVQKELAERYGDIEVLRQEYIDAEMRERGVMEAARKRAEEEAAKRKARADELRLLPEEELDRRYFEAVERGDDAAAREMLDEAARRKGYDDTESEYQGVGAWVAPSNPGYETDEARRDAVGEDSPNLNVEDMAAGYSNQPEDIFVHPDKYSQGLSTSKESGKAIQTAIDDIRNGKKEVKIKVYRAVPTSVKESKLRNGDWVTPSKEYAEMHGNNRLEGKYRIIEDEVPAGELWWDGNDVNEWGFDDGKGYKYKNVENSRKLNDLVTRDDNGEIIVPSKRFDENVEDVRYRTSEELDQINQKFNERLDELVSNPNQKDKVLHLGRSSEFLKDGGVSDAEIVLDYDKLVRKSKEGYKHEHPFDISDVRDLPIAIAYPIAVFDNTNGKNDGKVILTELKKDGRNFIVAIQTANLNRKGGKVLEVNKIVTLFPKDARGVVNWFNTGKATNIDKKKALHFIEALLNHSETTITNEELLSAANVVKDFETLQLSASEKAKQQAANDLAQQMHVEGEVEVVTSTEGLTGRQAKAKGWYDVRTEKVTIVLPNNKNAADVRETVFHEVVAHKGLRNLVGEEHFNTFLDNVYNNAEEGIKQTIDEMAEKKYNGDKRKATEEYMAHLAEDGEYVMPENQGFFAKVRDFLTDLLRKVGIKLGFKLTDNDLRYILWRSWKGLAERDGGSVFEKAEDVKMQHELGQTDEARSASGENGIMFREGSDELKDVVEKMKADVERLHEGELDDLRSGARAIGGRLSELNKAMRLQRAYDMSTVASVTELAKTMLKNGLLSEMSDYDVRRLLSVVNNVHGKGDIRPYVQKVVDMMVGNRLRNVSKAFDKLLAMRGKKVDARGVEVQGELDLAGQRMADVVWKGIGMSDDDVADMCADAQDRMMSANGAEAAAAATDYAGWQIVMHLGLLPYYNNLLAEYLASYTNTLQLIDCQYFTQCKILQISLAHNLHTPHAATWYKHGRRILQHRGAEKSVAPTDSSTSLWRKPHRIRPNRLRGSGVGCVRCMQGSV